MRSYDNQKSRSFFTGETLTKGGHDVYMVLGEGTSFPQPLRLKASGIEIITYNTRGQTQFDDQEDFQRQITLHIEKGAYTLQSLMAALGDRILKRIDAMFTDHVFLKTLREHKFNLAIVGGLPPHCTLLAYKLNIPYIQYSFIFDTSMSRTPSPASFVPLLTLGYTEKMTFLQRTKNALAYLTMGLSLLPALPHLSDDIVRKYAPEKPYMSLHTLMSKSLLFFKDSDVVLDYPVPRMPNVVDTGGLTTCPAKPLPRDLDIFVTNTKHGFILISFGTFIYKRISDNTLSKLMDTFGQVKQNVVFKYGGEVKVCIPNNTRVMKWLPQNDLLGHPNIKLFVTHCGSGGQFEALYHGVPMLGLPLGLDQHYNTARMEYHGFGKILKLHKCTARQLVDSINEIISNSSFSDRIQKASAIFRSRPQTPRMRLLFWVNHILQYGGSHLRSHAAELPWYQYVMLDVIGFFLIAVSLVLFLAVLIVSKLLQCCRQTPKLKTH